MVLLESYQIEKLIEYLDEVYYSAQIGYQWYCFWMVNVGKMW